MKMKPNGMSRDMPVDQLNIHALYIRLLHTAGINVIADFEHWTLEGLAEQGIGPAGLEILHRQLQYYGFSIGSPAKSMPAFDQSQADFSFPVLTQPAMSD